MRRRRYRKRVEFNSLVVAPHRRQLNLTSITRNFNIKLVLGAASLV